MFWEGAEPFSNEKKPKLGRRPKLEKEELLRRRHHVTSWIEQRWPNLSVGLRRARTSGEAIQAIIAARGQGGYPFQPPFYDRAEEFEEDLWSFLQSGKFHENPRNLASAVAGLPELSWKRSFDICSCHPNQAGMAVEAYWDYMRRKFPDRLRELSDARTTEQVMLVLSRSRTKDRFYLHLKEHADKALQWLEVGKPKVDFS